VKILFVTPETPSIGGGGIATYIKQARASFEAQGHEVYTFSWVFRDNLKNFKGLVSASRDRVFIVSGEEVWSEFPNGPFQVGLSFFLLKHIREFVEEIRPDIIETTDFQSPMYGYLSERRAGRLKDIENIPVIGFNHGLTRILYSKNGTLPNPYAQGEMVAERQAMRWCDGVFVPSESALKSFEYQVGRLNTVITVSEPFVSDGMTCLNATKELNLYHLGRLSFLKGVDHEIHFLNVLSSIRDINKVHFIGSSEWLPFRVSDVKDYVSKRISKKLLPCIEFHGQTDQDEFESIMQQGGFSMNFSRQETFNYAMLEMLSHGLFPFVKAGTAMEEFLPEELRRIAIGETFDLRQLDVLLDDVEKNRERYFEGINEHVKALTNPANYVNAYERFLEKREEGSQLGNRLKKEVGVCTGTDVTVLMATYNNPELIKETIASLRTQIVKPGKIVVLDDGSNQPEALETLSWIETLPDFKVIRSTANEGLCACRVKLLEHADTALSIFVDSDDLLAPEYLKKTLSAINNSKDEPDAVMTWRRNFGVSNELVIMDLQGDHYHLLRNDFRMTALIRTEALKRIGFDSSMRNGEADDWLFWLNFNRLGYKTVMVGEALFLYRFSEGSMSWPWSQGQATLTGVEVAKFVAENRGEFSDQAYEDIYADRIWHQLNSSSDQQAGYNQIAGDTFGKLFRAAVRLRETRPWLFTLLQKTSRLFVRLVN
jgi:glycosyltransferase involved in cell wall biosynthesis